MYVCVFLCVCVHPQTQIENKNSVYSVGACTDACSKAVCQLCGEKVFFTQTKIMVTVKETKQQLVWRGS